VDVVVTAGTLTLTGAQASGLSITGAGAVIITDVTAANDLSGIETTGGLTIQAADGETELTVTAAQADGATVEGFEGAPLDKVTVTDLQDALGTDLSGVNATAVEVQLDSTGNVEIGETANLAGATVIVSGEVIVTAAPPTTGDLTDVTFDVGADATVSAEADGSTIPLDSGTGAGTFRVENITNENLSGTAGDVDPVTFTVFSFDADRTAGSATITDFETGVFQNINVIDIQEVFAASDFANVAAVFGADDQSGTADILSFSVYYLDTMDSAADVANAFDAGSGSGYYVGAGVVANFGSGAERIFWTGGEFTTDGSNIWHWLDAPGGTAGVVDASELTLLTDVDGLAYTDLADLTSANFIFA
jgi:hypothetical protein